MRSLQLKQKRDEPASTRNILPAKGRHRSGDRRSNQWRTEMTHRITALALAAAGAIHLALAVPASAAGPVAMMNGPHLNGLTYNGLDTNGLGARSAEHRRHTVAAFDFNAVEATEIVLPEVDEPRLIAAAPCCCDETGCW
jgi:hypothetical protein